MLHGFSIIEDDGNFYPGCHGDPIGIEFQIVSFKMDSDAAVSISRRRGRGSGTSATGAGGNNDDRYRREH